MKHVRHFSKWPFYEFIFNFDVDQVIEKSSAIGFKFLNFLFIF